MPGADGIGVTQNGLLTTTKKNLFGIVRLIQMIRFGITVRLLVVNQLIFWRTRPGTLIFLHFLFG
jgi:hypothetical protein